MVAWQFSFTHPHAQLPTPGGWGVLKGRTLSLVFDAPLGISAMAAAAASAALPPPPSEELANALLWRCGYS